jgi:4-carboxymuconolactone decarboxylase
MENPRFDEYVREQLSAEQQRVFDAIAASPRGVVPTPFHILLESPELASLTQALGSFCRYRTGFPPHLSELMVLMTAAHWQADYEFATHAPEARKAGIPDETIAALRERKTPVLSDPDSQLVYDFTRSFYETRDVPDALFARAVERFGRPRVVELAAVLGYYSLLAILLKIFRVPAKTKN